MSKISFKGIKNKVLVRIFLHSIQNNTRIVCYSRKIIFRLVLCLVGVSQFQCKGNQYLAGSPYIAGI